MKFLMNFTTSYGDVQRYSSCEDLKAFYEKYGLCGLEVMPLMCLDGDDHIPPEACPVVTPDMVTGVHTCSIANWMELDREFLLEHYRRDLAYAKAAGAEYVVFHITQVSEDESWSYRMRHTEEEVIDASCSLINALLDGQDWNFWFLMENLWWPGLTFLEPANTRRLLEGVRYEKKGLVLDTGHFMHTDLNLATQEEALRALHAMLDAHAEVISYMKGIHLHQSLTGAYVQNWLKNPARLPEDPEERFSRVYEHIFAIDRHEPFTASGVRGFVERIDPLYVTYEYITSGRKEHAEYLEAGRRAFNRLQRSDVGIRSDSSFCYVH